MKTENEEIKLGYYECTVLAPLVGVVFTESSSSSLTSFVRSMAFDSLIYFLMLKLDCRYIMIRQHVLNQGKLYCSEQASGIGIFSFPREGFRAVKNVVLRMDIL